MHRAIEHQAKNLDDAGNLVALLNQFSQGLTLLDDYDHETITLYIYFTEFTHDNIYKCR